jgi:Inovirus Gp2
MASDYPIEAAFVMPGESLYDWLCNIEAIDAKDQVTDKMLYAFGIEAITSHKLSHNEISALYLDIKNIVRFVSCLRPHLGPEDLTEEYLGYGGRLNKRWSKLGLEFIDRMMRAKKIVHFLNRATPHTKSSQEGEKPRGSDERGIQVAPIPVQHSYLKPHPCVQALANASLSFEMVFAEHFLKNYSTPKEQTEKCLAEAFKTFTDPEKVQALKKAVESSRRKCNKNYQSLKRYLKSLLSLYKKLMVVRLDLYYRQPFAQDPAVCSHHRITADRVQFLNLIRQDYPAFVGYAWKIEVGIQRHWHAHTLLCFDGNHVRLDAVIGRRLGEAWVQLTKEQGDYFNCNGKRRRYKHDAIGEVKENDPGKEALLLGYPVTYMTKIDYYAALELPGGARTFGKGQILKVKKVVRRRKPNTS